MRPEGDWHGGKSPSELQGMPDVTYVIGIDPSITSTGVCLLHSDKPPKFHTVGAKKRNIDKTEMPLALRLWHLHAALMSCLPVNSQPLIAAIETPISPLAVNSRMGGTGFNTNIMAYAMCYEMLGKFRIPYVEFSPQQRAMIATGTGHADKTEVCEAFWTLHRSEESLNLNNNEIDAYWLAMGAAEVLNTEAVMKEFPLRSFKPFEGWINLPDRVYDMIEAREVYRP